MTSAVKFEWLAVLGLERNAGVPTIPMQYKSRKFQENYET